MSVVRRGGGEAEVTVRCGQGSIFSARLRADLSEASDRPGELKIARLAA
ncbi:MAG: hypothetical protein K8S99_18035 [Planctomycetes bacterium]|nr:hypothetical protein [Planctomycetota bacterium]